MTIASAIKSRIFKKSSNGDQRRSANKLEGGRRQGEVENPYLAARRTWNDQVSANAANRHMWQMLGLLSLMIALAGVGGVIYIGSQSRFIPYVVEVDRHSETIAISVAQRAAPVDARVVHATLAEFINHIRMVTPDVALQRKAIFQVYSMLSSKDPAIIKATEWLNGSEGNTPFVRAEKETVSIEITSVLSQTPDTWQIDWTESVRDRQGIATGPPFRMRALVTVYTVETTPQTTEEQIRNNPLGIYVRDFSWAKKKEYEP